MDVSKGRVFSIGLHSPGAARLREAVNHKLSELMGSYTDDVLVEYVVVLVCNGKHQIQARNDLDAFLGDESGAFVSWLWDHLATNIHLYMAPSQTSVPTKGNFTMDEQGKDSSEKRAKRWTKVERKRTSEGKAKGTVDIEPLSKDAQVSNFTHEELDARPIGGTESLQRRERTGFDDNSSSVRREIPRLQTKHYQRGKFEADASDQHKYLKHNSALKRKPYSGYWSSREQSLQDEKHADERMNSSPRSDVPWRLLQSAVKEAATPSELANSKRSESEVKRLRSVVVENLDAVTDTIVVPRMTNNYAKSIPAKAAAMKMDAAVTVENDGTRVRSTGSVWDRLGKASDKDRLEEGLNGHMIHVGGRPKIENRLSKPDNRAPGHGNIDSRSGRSLSSRLSRGLTEGLAMIENESLVLPIDGEGYGELQEDALSRLMHAHASSSKGNRQTEESDTHAVSHPLTHIQGKHVPTKGTDKGNEASVTVNYNLAQNIDKTIIESRKQNAPCSGVAKTKEKIVNISVNVNTWKQPQYQSGNDAIDKEAVAASAGVELLQDQTEISVNNSLAEKMDMGLEEESVRITHGSDQNDLSGMRSRLHQVELEMTKLRAKQAEVRKDALKTSSSTSGVQTSLHNSEEDADVRTIFVTNVHFAATKEVLFSHFTKCGEVVNIIMLTDAATGQPKGSAYIVFASNEATEKALNLNETSLMSRMLKVIPKTASHLEAHPMSVQTPVHHALPSVVRSPIKAAYSSSSPYAYRKGCTPYSGSQHLQWKRDASAGGSSGKSGTPVPSLNGPAAAMSSIPIRDGNLTSSMRSFTYIRTPTGSSNGGPAPA